MKRLLACIVMIGAMAAPSLMAIPDSGTVKVTRQIGFFSGNGGEFTITSTTASFDAFQTFCLERSEYVGPNNHTYQLNADNAVVMGGNNLGAAAPGGGDPISEGTAWLYTQFRQGTLSGYDYSNTVPGGRAVSAGLLQNAIWSLEDEIGVIGVGLNAFYDAAIAKFIDLAGAKANYTGTYVKVMNMTDKNGVRAQDFLAVPDGGLTVALLGMGLAGLGWVNRRIRR